MKKIVTLYLSFLGLLNIGFSQVPCNDISKEDFVVVNNNSGTNTIEYCLPIEDMSEYEIYEDGDLLTSFNSCDFFTSVSFTMSGLNVQGGPAFVLDSWDNNGTVYTGSFDNISQLVDSMNVWDEPAIWESDGLIPAIKCSNCSGEYENLIVSELASGIKYEFSANYATISNKTSITVPLKLNYSFEVLNIAKNCVDEIFIEQCFVDAGPDRNVCLEEIINNPVLEGEIVGGDVSGLAWESQYYQSYDQLNYFASLMLNDTTILNPTVIQHFEKSVKYYLTGITSDNQSCTDSVVLNFSDWVVLTVDKREEKQADDTIQLYTSAQSVWEHIQYEWSPNIMISDTTVENPLVWNDTTIFYNLVITDELNCTLTDDIFEVYVSTTSIDKVENADYKVFPNPTSSLVKVESFKEINKLELYDLSGRVINRVDGNQLDVANLSAGQYIVKVIFVDDSVGTKMININ